MLGMIASQRGAPFESTPCPLLANAVITTLGKTRR